ncbi:putative chemotactic sensor histidine kinase/response regulator domain protein [Pseudomonas syringae pv. atrofaciens]|nr:putative chemotactic sensor histidine kinase/response regulator domain protein [Pseudomonas syringae pv. atrofaciens]
MPPSAGEEAVDDELRDVFLEEADEVLDALREYLPRWFASLGRDGHWDSTALTEVRRAFHTLKGSGRMVRALILSELAWSVENLLNRVLEGDVLPGLEVQQLMSEVQALLPSVIRDFAEDAQCQRDDVDLLAARAHALANGLEPPTLPAVDDPAPGKPVADEPLDPQLLEIFRQEALGHLNTLGRFLDNAEQSASPAISDAVLRALHTLKGSAHMAGVLPIAELASPLDQLVREYKANLIDIGSPELVLLRSAEPLLHKGLEQLDSTPLADIPGAAPLIEAALAMLNDRLTVVLRESDSGLRIKRNPTLLAGFLAEGMDIVLDAENLLRGWRQHPGERQELSALLDELTTLGHGAHLADLPQVDELCEALLDLYGAVEESSLAVSERFFDVAENAHEALINMLDQVAAGQDVEPRPECVRALNQLLDQALDPSATGLVKSDGHRTLSVTELNAATAQLASEAGHTETEVAGPDDEIVEIFLEEAVDILDSAGQALQRWLADPENPAPLASLQRDLHTLKGGARMAEVAEVGDLAHELGYDCLVAHAADDGFNLASRYTPDAILLDMRLPDHSGLTVLQRLKELAPTRHIPVHVISVEDRQEAALHMGAIGYAVKPTTREELKDVFAKLEAKLTQKVKRILLVEDDALQRDSIARLIGDDDIEITAVGFAQEALDLLRDHVYDCMIIDLKLPDMLGNELLKRMSMEDICAFPPVIVYTGRNMTRDEEAELMKYSRSIIIKGARSPERLLDEVTLFLHKVESQLSNERQKMLKTARSRDKVFEARKILVVDDDVRNIFALTSALEHKGAVVEIARNGLEAIARLNEVEDIDLVLMDVMMPEMDGFEATIEIRKDPRWRKLPIIAVTAKAMKDDQERCLQAGSNDYLAKPIDLDRLFSLIRVWLPKMERI